MRNFLSRLNYCKHCTVAIILASIAHGCKGDRNSTFFHASEMRISYDRNFTLRERLEASGALSGAEKERLSRKLVTRLSNCGVPSSLETADDIIILGEIGNTKESKFLRSIGFMVPSRAGSIIAKAERSADKIDMRERGGAEMESFMIPASRPTE